MLNPMLNEYLAEATRMDRLAEATEQRRERSTGTAQPSRSSPSGAMGTSRIRRRYATLQH